jgi:hypothetical protein
MSCHIGMDYAENSRWWGIQLYRKIGGGDWLPVENANGSNADWLEGSPCWISHNMGADNSMYSHSIINVSGSYEDSPQTTEDVYYTAYWKSKLNNSFGRLYINRPATISSAYTSNYPLTSSSWTASEIWNNGLSYVPMDTSVVSIAYNKVGIGTVPVQNSPYKLDVNGALNASNYFINGKPLSQISNDFKLTQGMIVQMIHKTYRDTKAKEDNTTSWVPIDIDNLETGFVVRIKPTHITSKVLVSMSCHIGMDYAENSRWWGIQLYRKIGDGNWLPVENANGSNDDWLEGSPCWISHNMGADSSLYSHSIINVSGSYADSPTTTNDVYYTAYWKSKLNNSFGRLYINRPATISGGAYTSNYPLTSSSWTVTEIWNNGEPYVPIDSEDNTIIIASNNVGIGTVPLQNSPYKLDVYGALNASNYFINGKPLSQDFKLTQGMIVQTVHKTYRDTKAKEDNTTSWVAIDNNIVAGFVIRIKPSHATSKVLISMSCHIGMDYAENSRWWGIQLYRKIGNGNWLPVENANGSNDDWLEGSPCWISHNMGADNSMYSHSIINVSGSYEDSPATVENVYYTAYWKSKLNNSFGRLYINRPATISSAYTSNYPLTSSSWTASEIWNNGEPYVPVDNGDNTIMIVNNNVGIGTVPLQNSPYKLDVVGDIRANNFVQTSDYRCKKNIESIHNVLESVNSLRPVSYLTLDQQSTDKKSYGFIAQELNELFPNVVNEPKDNNEFYSIKYVSMIPLLVKSIQELTATIEFMREEVDILKQKIYI